MGLEVLVCASAIFSASPDVAGFSYNETVTVQEAPSDPGEQVFYDTGDALREDTDIYLITESGSEFDLGWEAGDHGFRPGDARIANQNRWINRYGINVLGPARFHHLRASDNSYKQPRRQPKPRTVSNWGDRPTERRHDNTRRRGGR